MGIKQIYHPYNLWEDYKNGMYSVPNTKDKEMHKEAVISFFNDIRLTEMYMEMVIIEWPRSSEHNLSNRSINRVAYIGQAACCLFKKIPNISTMYAWKFLDINVRCMADKIALKTILKWEQEKKYNHTFINGKIGDTIMEYQTKLLLS